MARDLSPIFRPASIAVIGATADPSHIRGRITAQLLASGFPGEIYPVNPKGGEIQGRKTYTSIGAVPDKVDLALIAIPASAVAGVLDECAAAGVRAAYIYSSGFAEEEGSEKRALQDRIRAFSRATGVIVAGPNAVGLMNAALPFIASFTPTIERTALDRLATMRADRRLAVISQSGGLAFSLFDRGFKRRLPFSYVISTGNEADLDLVEVAEFLLDDPSTGVILMVVEEVRRGPEFVALAKRALDLGKPIVAAKIGRSPAARRAAISHTASMTGEDAAYAAVFRRYGVVRGEDQEDMLDIAAAAALCPEPRGGRVGIVTISGGAGGWLADALDAHGLSVPELGPDVQRQVREFLPSYGAASNPIDITAQAIGTDFRFRSTAVLEASEAVDSIVVAGSLTLDGRLPAEKDRFKELVGRRRKPVLFYSYPLPGEAAEAHLEDIGVPLYTGIRGVARALSLLAERAEAHAAHSANPRSARLPAANAAAALKRLDAAGTILTEAEALAVLGDYGIRVPRHALVESARAAMSMAKEIGFPVALKVQSPDLPHKTEAGAVRLGLGDAAAVSAAYDAVLANARRAKPEARIQGVLVEAMARPGVELILGLGTDETFGPLVMLGRGGIDVEALGDRVMTPLPVDLAEAERLIHRLDRGRWLSQPRGRPACDLAALAQFIAAVARLAADFAGRVRELDINPLIVGAAGEGVAAVDALMVQRKPG